MRTPEPVAKIKLWLDENGIIHAESDDGTPIELRQDDPSLVKIRAILETQQAALLGEEERAQREARSKIRPFDCPLTEVKCVEGGLCSRNFCIRKQRELDAAAGRSGRL
jgi:hypothetical protein